MIDGCDKEQGERTDMKFLPHEDRDTDVDDELTQPRPSASASTARSINHITVRRGLLLYVYMRDCGRGRRARAHVVKSDVDTGGKIPGGSASGDLCVRDRRQHRRQRFPRHFHPYHLSTRRHRPSSIEHAATAVLRFSTLAVLPSLPSVPHRDRPSELSLRPPAPPWQLKGEKATHPPAIALPHLY